MSINSNNLDLISTIHMKQLTYIMHLSFHVR
jgi:hypothetical protein